MADTIKPGTILITEGVILPESLLLEKVLARWEDSQYSFNLYQPSYQSTFGMVIYSKRLDALARASIVKAIRLDEQEAPQRETERQKKKNEENRSWQEKARQANKAPFRP